MAKGSLFEYAIIYHPAQTKEDKDKGIDTKSILLLAPKTVLAASQESVTILASRDIPAEYVDRLDKVEIVVRPF
jgi:hypothetical protein